MGYDLNQRDVVLVPVPFSDQRKIKVRPALIISGDEYNARSDDVIVAAMTSSIIGRVDEISIDVEQGALPLPTVVRADSILKVHGSLVIKTVAQVNTSTLRRVREHLLSILL